MRHARSLAALLCAAAPLAPVAAAPAVGRVVAFGDSYADIGNLRAILVNSGLGALYPSAQYPTGRFSGGTNFVDTIAAAYGVPQANYAVGGAEAGTGNVAGQGLLPGFQQQWVAFTQGGSTYTSLPIAFPLTVSGVATTIPAGGLQFTATDLGVFSVGGNDARDYRLSGGTLAGAPAAADAVAATAVRGMDALVSRGLRRLVWTAGDVGQLAEAIGQPNAPVGTAFSTEYNARLQTALARYAASGVQVGYVDIVAVGNTVRADPARFGFTNTTAACPQACIGNPTLQQQYFFYVDGVHLTSAAFALVGEYAVNQLDAPWSFRMTGDTVLRTAQQFGQDVGNRLDLARGGVARQGLAVFGSFTASRDRYRADAASDGYLFNSRGGEGGVEYGAGPVTAGAIFSYADSHADGLGDDRARDKAYQVAGYAVAAVGPAFAQVYGGYGWHHERIRRTGVADPLTAAPHATSLVAGVRAGWLAGLGPVRIGPTLGADYARARLDGYAEAGDAAAALVVGRQRIETVVGSAGLEARAAVAGVAPWLRVAAADDLEGDGRLVSYAPAVAPTIVNGFSIPDASRRVYGTVAGGLSAALLRGVSVEAAGRATFSRDTGNAAGGTVGLRARF